jgi:hypothetical protein
VAPRGATLWSHGHPGALVRGQTTTSELDLATIKIELQRKSWQANAPVTLVACTAGQELNGAAQKLANYLNTTVYASISSTLAMADGPLQAPYGWAIFRPEPNKN